MSEAVCGICKEKSKNFVTVCDKKFHETCLDQLITKISTCPSCKNAANCNPRLEAFLATFTGTEEQVNKLDKEFILTLFYSKYCGYSVEPVLRRYLLLGGDIDTLLHLAIENSNEELVKTLLKNGAKIDASNEEGQTPLHIACKKLILPIIKLLIEAGADTKIKDNEGCPPYFYALNSKDKDFEVIKYLLETGAGDLNAEDKYDGNCLNYAVKNGSLELLLFLIGKGVKIIVQRRRFGLVHEAAASKKLEILRHLVEVIHVPCDMSEYDGMTPLIIAARNGSVEMVKILLKNGAKPFKKDHDEASPLTYAVLRNHYEVAELLLKHSTRTINDAPFIDSPPIFMALAEGNIKMAELLFSYRANISLKSREGWNIVEFMCAHNVLREGLEFLLRRTKLSFQAFMGKYAPNSKPLILLASSRLATHSVKKLIELGFDVKEQDDNLNTALHLACKSSNYELVDGLASTSTGNSELVDFLLKCGLDPLARNKYGETPLLYVINTPVLKRVLESCPNPLEVEKPGDNLLPVGFVARAAVQRSIESVKLLINHGADVNIPSPEGITAMHCACQYKNLEMIDVLVKAGFKLNEPFRSRPACRVTLPLAYALALGDEGVTKILIEKGASLEYARDWATKNSSSSQN